MANTAVSVPPSTVIAVTIPARLSPASTVVTGPRLRGTLPRARSPRRARARRRVTRGVRAALIDEHQPGRIDRGHLGAPRGARGLVALGGAQTFDFSGRPGRRRRPAGVNAPAEASAGSVVSARDIVASDTTRPASAV